MTIDLAPDDVHDLLEVVDYRLRELQDELVHTDDRSFRDGLRRASGRLEELRARLQLLATAIPARRDPSPLARPNGERSPRS